MTDQQYLDELFAMATVEMEWPFYWQAYMERVYIINELHER